MRGTVFPMITLVALAAPTALHGQQPAGAFASADSTVVDRIAAVVGDSVILLTEVQERLFAASQQGQELDPREVLSNLVNQQLILQAAERDTTLTVPDEELDRRVDEAMTVIRDRFTTEAGYRQALEQQGLTPTSLRDMQRHQIGTQLVQELFTRRQLQSTPPVAVTEAEMRAFYEDQRATLQARPELLTLQQILVPVKASDESWAEARALADSLHREVQGGADFEGLAREFSEDEGTAADGGDLGWFRRGQMVREFEAVAFNQRPGAVSPPVRTDFGWHVILTERVRPGEVKARHILIRPEVTEENRQAARARAEEVAEAARAGADLEALAGASEGEIQPEEFDQLQRSRDQLGEIEFEGYAENLAGVTEGEVVEPFRTVVGNGEYFAVVRVEEVREAGEFTFEDLREQIREALTQQKKLERILERLRAETYVDIRM